MERKTIEELQLKDLNSFIENFKTELDKVENKLFLIENEIKRIDSILYTHNDGDKINLLNWTQPKNENDFDINEYWATLKNKKVEFYIECIRIREVFHEYQKTGEYIFRERKIINEEEFTDSDFESLEKINENEKIEIVIIKKFTDYYNWLKELKVKSPKKSDLNIHQKLLALELLGIDIQEYKNNHTAEVLGQILNVAPSSMRGDIQYMYTENKINKIKNIENFQKLLELFKNQTFESISNRINREIHQLKQKK